MHIHGLVMHTWLDTMLHRFLTNLVLKGNISEMEEGKKEERTA